MKKYYQANEGILYCIDNLHVTCVKNYRFATEISMWTKDFSPNDIEKLKEITEGEFRKFYKNALKKLLNKL